MFIRKCYEIKEVPEMYYRVSSMEPYTVTMTKILESSFSDAFGREVPAKKLTVIRLGGLGDLVLLSSALVALKESSPGLEIMLVTGEQNVGLLEGVPYLRRVVAFDDIRRYEHECILDLRMKVEPQDMHVGSPINLYGSLPTSTYRSTDRTKVFCSLLGIESDGHDPEIFVDYELAKAWKDILGKKGDEKWLLLQATCTSDARSIPPDYVLDLIRELSKEWVIVLVGKREEWHGGDLPSLRKGNVISLLSERLTARDLVAIVSFVDFVVAPNSACACIAGALKKKAVVLFGNIDPELRVGHFHTVKALYPGGELPCVPCDDLIGCNLAGKIGADCLRCLTPKRVIEAIEEWSKDQNPKGGKDHGKDEGV